MNYVISEKGFFQTFFDEVPGNFFEDHIGGSPDQRQSEYRLSDRYFFLSSHELLDTWHRH